MSATPEPIEEIKRLFESIGYTVRIWQADGEYWADLISIRNGQTFWPGFGRGDTADDAVRRAIVRYRTEQGPLDSN